MKNVYVCLQSYIHHLFVYAGRNKGSIKLIWTCVKIYKNRYEKIFKNLKPNKPSSDKKCIKLNMIKGKI